ncbi:acylphosphatase [Denitratimonas sp. CY0512]|uniref:acylphosphatase n=1 Tax=Denitratimonas sp. CY0512 TaxID=3131940 RepID=UPI00309AED5A
MRSTVRFLVEGRVQGVFYRVSTRDRAVALGLDGHALNLLDGRVEVLVAGSPTAIDALATWLRQGPEKAQVSAVKREDAGGETVAPGFRTG